MERPEVGVSNISWSNFRSFRRADVELKRITVFIGSNNSGKSSLHRPLTLLKQTLEIDSPFPGLLTRGPLVDCGSFTDCSFWGNESPISFRLALDRPITLTRNDAAGQMQVGAVHLGFEKGPPLNPFQLQRFRIDSPSGTRLLERVRQQEGSYDIHGEIRKGNPPNSPFDRALRASINDDQPYHFLFRSGQIVSSAVERLEVSSIQANDTFLMSQFGAKYMAVSDVVAQWFESWLTSLSYVGPSRAAPQRTYRFGSVYAPSRPDGAEVPEILFRVLKGEEGLYAGSPSQFQFRLARYLRMLRLGATVDAEQVGEDSFSIYLSDRSSQKVNLVDSAFGFSQVLPLVVRVLLTRPRETLIIEQPEIHLNPAVQSGLADVIVRGVSRDSCAIIETHSEHFLNRLRTLVASGELSSEELGVYFVERGPKQSRVRRVNVLASGALDHTWPSGFFGDALRQARELNRAQRKYSERQG